MSGVAEAPYPVEDLYVSYQPWREGHGKNIGIVRSVSAWISINASAILIWTILRSRVGLRTTFHRLLLGLSISDIIHSLSVASFNAMAPSESYIATWNPHGNVATCSAAGFLGRVGSGASLLYCCSINIYFLTVVMHNKSDRFIQKKIEPWLHTVPVLGSLLIGVPLLIQENFNDDNIGSCWAAEYRPAHCIGIGDGVVREGFTIPCGRGHDGLNEFSVYAIYFMVWGVPIIIVGSSVIMYWAVLRQEKRVMSRNDNGCGDGTSYPGRGASRMILNRTLGYTVSYFLTWFSLTIGVALTVNGDPWPLSVIYLTTIFVPLQGFFNLLVFLFPKVICAKVEGVGWCKAFAGAIWSRQDMDGSDNDNKDATEDQAQDTNDQASEELLNSIEQMETPVEEEVFACGVPVARQINAAGDQAENNRVEEGRGTSSTNADTLTESELLAPPNNRNPSSSSMHTPVAAEQLAMAGITVAVATKIEENANEDNLELEAKAFHNRTQRMASIGLIPNIQSPASTAEN